MESKFKVGDFVQAKGFAGIGYIVCEDDMATEMLSEKHWMVVSTICDTCYDIFGESELKLADDK